MLGLELCAHIGCLPHAPLAPLYARLLSLSLSASTAENVNQDAARELTSSVEEFERHVQEDVAKYASG